MEQDRDTADIAAAIPDDGTLDAASRADALLGLVTIRYTQSNSVAFTRDGASIGIGAGQQNRVDCVRLAGVTPVPGGCAAILLSTASLP